MVLGLTDGRLLRARFWALREGRGTVDGGGSHGRCGRVGIPLTVEGLTAGRLLRARFWALQEGRGTVDGVGLTAVAGGYGYR